MKKLSFIALLCCMVVASVSATTRKVLFIGNSYIYTNDMPLMLQTLATSLGDTLVYDQSTPGGHTFNQHTTNATTISKIFSQQWDIVILQEQSQLPSFDPTQVAAEVYPYATRLDSMIHANDTCTQTMFLMTWGRANGDASNCAAYPPICTYWGMQQRLRESYMEMAQTNNAVVAPVGMAYKVMRDSAYTPWLYSADESHPVVAGSYLEACVLYGSIFHKRTRGASYLGGLTDTEAVRLQRIADKVVFDSLSLWQEHGHYPNAIFGGAVPGIGATVTFTSNSIEPASHLWNFGDATTDTAAGPAHTYTSVGTYVVSHTVSTDCFTETQRDTLLIQGDGIAAIESTPVKIAATGNGSVVYQLMADMDRLEIVDMRGVVVKRYSRDTLPATDNLVPGIYVYRVYANHRVGNYKVAVY